MDKQEQSVSYDSFQVGAARRVPLPLLPAYDQQDLEQVAIEIAPEEGVSSDRAAAPIAPHHAKANKPAKVVRSNTQMKVFVFLYLGCCLWMCRGHRKTRRTAVVPTVANKYRVPEEA